MYTIPIIPTMVNIPLGLFIQFYVTDSALSTVMEPMKLYIAKPTQKQLDLLYRYLECLLL